MSTVAIRPEDARDNAAIRSVSEAAFADAEHGSGNEPAIIERLRRDGDLALSLVAEDEERIVGHVAFSPITISGRGANWYGLGPLSVLPECQRQGVGFRLVQRGIADLRERGAKGIVVLGDPAYYGRFGFAHDPQLAFPGPPPQYFQYLLIGDDMPRGDVCYAPAFG